MKIAIASGKGGTGKSTVSTNLAYILSKDCKDITLIDCDAEEPNCHIFFKTTQTEEKDVFINIPVINEEECKHCGKCSEICKYNAITSIKNKVYIFEELCHGCESCIINCKHNAIEKKQKTIGTIKTFNTGYCNLIEGKLNIGEVLAPKIIQEAKKIADNKKNNINIIDCPPGTSCPMINAIEDVDFVILVTEPTPFGFYDLKLATEVIKKLKIPFGIVINRSNENDILIENWAKDNKIKIITKIPNKKTIAKNYSEGKLITKEDKELEKYFTPIINQIKELKND